MLTIEGKWFVFRAKGHKNIRSIHRTTFEITKDPYLTPRGDCIIGISSEASASDLPQWLKNSIRKGAIVVILICVDNLCDSIVGYGDPRMTLSDAKRMIFRKSNYVEPATVMVRASKAAKDIDRGIINYLRSGKELKVAITTVDFI